MNIKMLLVLTLLGSISLAEAQVTFSEQSDPAGLTQVPSTRQFVGGGAAFFDFNNDDFEDVYIVGGRQQPDALYQNMGNGTFTNVTISAGVGAATANLETLGVSTGDINNDGYRDIFVVTERAQRCILFLNKGNGTFDEITFPAGIGVYTAASGYTASFGDYNEDGYLDIYVANYVDTTNFTFDSLGAINGFPHDCFQNYFFVNNGNLTFTFAGPSMMVNDTGCSLSGAFTDYDSDGDVDIFSVNDFGEFVQPNQLYRNEYPADSFTNVSVASNIYTPGIYGMGLGIGDYDMDMDLDYYVTNIGRNTLYQNQGNGSFVDVANLAGVEDTYATNTDSFFTTGWGNGFSDLDNDMDLDLMIANGVIPVAPFIQNEISDSNKLYINNGDGTFTNATTPLIADADTLLKRGLAYADYDNDGDVDVLIIKSHEPPANLPAGPMLLQNTTVNSNNWLQVDLQGVVTNRDAFGTQMEVHVGGKSWIHEVSGGCSHASQHSSIAHFGLGTNTAVDSLVIHWLSGIDQTLYNIPANQRINVLEDTTNNDTTITPAVIEQNSSLTAIKIVPNPAKDFCDLQLLIQKEQSVHIQVFNPLGQLVYQREMGRQAAGLQHYYLKVADWPAGHYILQVQLDQERISRQLVVH